MSDIDSSQKERSLFKLLMVIAYIATLVFSAFYFVHDVRILAYNGLFCFSVYVVIGVASLYAKKLTLLFRLSVLIAFHAFYFQVFFTGGVLSPSLSVFIIPPVIGFLYRPIRDRYIFMVVALLCAVSMWPLTIWGYTRNDFPIECAMENSMVSTLFVFAVVGLYVYMFRRSLSKKNRQLRKSLSELQSTSQKLIEAEKMASLGMMSAGVAHEINNPLNFIRGGIDMLSLELSESKKVQPYIEAVDEGVKRASAIVNSLGNFSRKTDVKDEICDLHEVIDNCLVMINHKLKFRIDIEKKYCQSSPMRVMGNGGQLHQAILNVLVNAEQAIDDKGTITIETSDNGHELSLIISDTGVGISPENLNRIRDPFFTTKGAGEGTGLGLSITYKIIEEHHGRIEVASQPSKGTSFQITFRKTEEVEP